MAEETKKSKILLIEDDAFMSDLLTTALARVGFDVSNVKTGAEGVRLFGEWHPDLILLDLILPRIDGFEVLSLLKANPKTISIPVIVLTNLEGSADVERALALGATTYLVKTNYRLEEVIEKVKQAIH